MICNHERLEQGDFGSLVCMDCNLVINEGENPEVLATPPKPPVKKKAKPFSSLFGKKKTVVEQQPVIAFQQTKISCPQCNHDILVRFE